MLQDGSIFSGTGTFVGMDASPEPYKLASKRSFLFGWFSSLRPTLLAKQRPPSSLPIPLERVFKHGWRRRRYWWRRRNVVAAMGNRYVCVCRYVSSPNTPSVDRALTASLLIFVLQALVVFYSGSSLSDFSAYPSTKRVIRYDTGTIGGVIAMQDWLQTFGKFDNSLLDNGNLGFYIPTNDKSLVVSSSVVVCLERR